jgi:hypothetical protein
MILRSFKMPQYFQFYEMLLHARHASTVVGRFSSVTVSHSLERGFARYFPRMKSNLLEAYGITWLTTQPFTKIYILGHDARKPEYWMQNRSSLLGNDSVNTFPRQRIRKQQSITSVAMQRRFKHAFPTIALVFSEWSVPKSYLEGNWRYRAVEGSAVER